MIVVVDDASAMTEAVVNLVYIFVVLIFLYFILY